jgi:elongation factor P hydroxylase
MVAAPWFIASLETLLAMSAVSNITVIRKSFQSWMLMVAVIFQKRLQETVQDFFNPRLNQKATTLWQRLQLFYSERRPWTM